MNPKRIEYVLYHIAQIIDLENIYGFLKIGRQYNPEIKGIYFPLSKSEFDANAVKWFSNIPILFPLSENKQPFIINGKSVLFQHDFLQSAFYLLSGFQEYRKKYDYPLNRFSFNDSVQKELNVAEIPVVNYYFLYIIEGINEFCKINGINKPQELRFKDPIMYMTHDIDRTDYYNIHLVKLFLKQGKVLPALKAIYKYLFTNKNPYWNFDYIQRIEEKHNITSTFYFLLRGLKHKDAYYQLSEDRISELIDNLESRKHEIGLHGSIESAFTNIVMTNNYEKLNKRVRNTIVGIRQHWYNYYPVKTAWIQINNGLRYDSSLGFHDKSGFRNSYCYPFKLYDFDNEKMLDLWEIPLILMDRSLFHYEGLEEDQAKEQVLIILEQIKKFNGIFTLLIHNSFLGDSDQVTRELRCSFWEWLIEVVLDMGFKSKTGRNIIQELSCL